MAVEVKLEAFEGPLDLLLHLIDKNKVDIYDIPISLITARIWNTLIPLVKATWSTAIRVRFQRRAVRRSQIRDL